MQKIFLVYNERMTKVPVDIPEGATNEDIAELVNDRYYAGYNVGSEEIDDPIAIEDGEGHDLSYLLGIGGRYTCSQMEDLLRRIVDFAIRDHESGEGLDAAKVILEAMGFSEEQMMYFGFPETE